MHPKDTDALKTWLTLKLRPLCDADPLALAKYVFALIRKDKPTDTLRELCIDQLEVFLGRETLNFVSELFHVLENGVPDMKETVDIPESPSDWDESAEKGSENVKTTLAKKTTSEDLKYSELDDEDRDFKRARKEDDTDTKTAISPITFPSSNSAGLLKRKRAIEEGRSLPRKASRIRPPPLLPDAAKYVPNPPVHKVNTMERKQRCKDYDEKGFCLLGENCPYDHGLDPLVVEGGGFPPPPLNVPSTFFPPVPPQYLMVPPPPSLLPQAMNMPPSLPIMSADADTTGYNPEQPALSITTVPSTTPLLNVTTNTSSSSVLYTPAVSTTISSHSGDRPRMSRNHRTGGYYQRTPQEPTNTLVLRKVPADLNVLSKLNGHFDQFGKIVNLKVGFQNDSEAALVQFSTVAEAKAAHSSSSAVLGNRFIRVYFMRTPRYQSVTPNTMSVNNICEEEKSNDGTSAEVSSSNTVEDETAPENPASLANGKPEVSTTTTDEIVTAPKMTEATPAPKQQNITKHLPPSPTLTRPISAELILKQKELHLKMKALLDDQLKQQKALIAKLENGGKSLTADEKKKVMETVKTLSTNITKLKAQILHQQAQVKAPLKESAPVKTIEKPTIPAQIEPTKKNVDLRSKLRRKTREIVVYSVTPEMKEQLTGVFEKLGGLVQVRYDPLSPSDVIFTFKTQVDAKKAVNNGSVFDNKPLIMKWYYPKEETVANHGVLKERRVSQNATELRSPTVADNPTLLAEAIDLPDDDEEEESEERSWKR